MAVEHLILNSGTSIILRVRLTDTSNVPKASMTYASSGLVIGALANNEAAASGGRYTVAGSTIEDITTIGTYAAPTATKCRFKEVDATYHPGLYEIHLADARWAVSSAKYVDVSVSGVSGLLAQTFRVILDTPVDLRKRDGTLNVSSTISAAKLSIDNSAGSGSTINILGDNTASLVALTQSGTGRVVYGQAAGNHCVNWVSTTNDALRLQGTAGADLRFAGSGGSAGDEFYDAIINFGIDSANSQDEYTVHWRKNGVRQTSVTLGKIQVIKRSDGTDLIAANTSMTQVGTTGMWKYDALTTERSTAGEAIYVECKATIDGSVRTCGLWVSRDST